MNPRVFGAIVAGVILVVAAYVHTQSFSSESTQTGELIVGERNTIARGYIATNDQDEDGVPDWQQALRTTDPLELDELASSTYTTPDTLTDQFAVDLMNQMIQSKQFGEFGDSPDELIAKANDDLVAQAADTLYTTGDILVSDTDSVSAIRNYANRVAAIALEFGIPADTQNEVLILEKAIQTNNAGVLTELTVIEASYDNMIQAMLVTPVPKPLARQHLDLINAYHAILKDVQAFAAAFEDPLLALLRLQRYRDDATGLYYAFTGVFAAAYEAGARFETGDTTLEVVTIEP